jgi:hypothetical protein
MLKITLKSHINSIFYIFKILDILKLHHLNLKLCSKQYNKIDLLHLIVVSQLRGGWHAAPMTSLCILLCLWLWPSWKSSDLGGSG